MKPTKHQRKSRDMLAQQHIHCGSVEQRLGSEENPILWLRFYKQHDPDYVHCYLIRPDGKVTKMGLWP